MPGEGKDQRFVFDQVFGPSVAEESSYQAILPQALDATFAGKGSTIIALGKAALKTIENI